MTDKGERKCVAWFVCGHFDCYSGNWQAFSLCIGLWTCVSQPRPAAVMEAGQEVLLPGGRIEDIAWECLQGNKTITEFADLKGKVRKEAKANLVMERKMEMVWWITWSQILGKLQFSFGFYHNKGEGASRAIVEVKHIFSPRECAVFLIAYSMWILEVS